MNRSRNEKSNERTRRARRLDAINEEWNAGPFSVPTAIIVFRFCRDMAREFKRERRGKP